MRRPSCHRQELRIRTSGHDRPPCAASGGQAVELFLVSFLILFFELTCIRWFGSIVIFLTFFTNIVLMACFLGVSVGCLAASRRWNLIHGFIPGVLARRRPGLRMLVWCYFRYRQPA